MTSIRPGFARAVLAALVLASATAVGAQPYDHLECFKIKDLAPKQKYTADLTPEQTQFLAQTGCELKVPAKLFCIDVQKSNVAPAPPQVLNGQNTRDFLCYNLKCPPQAEVALQVEDQFGTRGITTKKKPSQLCAPARKIGYPDPATPTPCAPPSTPIPTSTPAPSCTDLTQNGGETDLDCGGPCPPCQLGEGCATAGDCVSGVCSAGVCTICSPGQQQSCGTMLPGPCAIGTQTCLIGGMSYSACQGPSPQAETCNNVDDNCNGTVDDGLGQTTCGTGICQNTVQNCVGGVGQSCTPGTPSAETCNSLDDNCDGIVDNNACQIVPNANGTCNGVNCLYVCSPGYSDCNGNPLADGCETYTLADNNNCGGCGLVCPGVTTCVAGVCQ